MAFNPLTTSLYCYYTLQTKPLSTAFVIFFSPVKRKLALKHCLIRKEEKGAFVFFVGKGDNKLYIWILKNGCTGGYRKNSSKWLFWGIDLSNIFYIKLWLEMLANSQIQSIPINSSQILSFTFIYFRFPFICFHFQPTNPNINPCVLFGLPFNFIGVCSYCPPCCYCIRLVTYAYIPIHNHCTQSNLTQQYIIK